MSRKITLESVIVYIKWSLFPSLSWPLPITATKWQIIRFKILAVLSHINVVCLLVPLLIFIQDCSGQRVICIQTYPFICGCFHFWTSVGVCHIQYKRFQQSLAGLQFSSMLCVSLLVALLLWFTTARFDILCNELRKASTVYELIQCIQKHQHLLRYANDVIENVRFVVLSVVGTNAVSVICTGAIFATRQPLIINLEFFMMTAMSFCDVFACCWPADSLLTASSDIAQATYESLWYYHNTDKQKNLIFILLKCRKPVILTVGCFIPILSLRYFSSYVSTGFSYMTTLHIMMTENNTNEV
ncbi:odorant receptor 49b-like isoform X2 [Linepithema humile]|uniref:odorant receptor 49b-like isoform X2 n=1 Tax=Linepithema humile TaxID=83485 RepID=UPI00351DFB54